MIAAFEIPMNFGIMLGICIILPMFIPLALINAKRVRRRQPCTDSVSAQVVRVDKHRFRRNHHNHITYAPVYAYCYNGKEYTRATWGISSRPRKVGDLVTIKVNPHDPEQFYDPKHERWGASTEYLVVMMVVLIGAIFMALGIYDFIVTAKTEADPSIAAAWLLNWKG